MADTSSIAALIANDGGDGISLREAVNATNNTTGQDTITFDGSVFTGGANSLIRLTQGELRIDTPLHIDASTATDVTISGDADGDDITFPGTFITDVTASFGGTVGAADDLLDDNSRVLRSYLGRSLTLSNLTVTGGRTTGNRDAGGGIRFGDSGGGDTLSLINSTISGNSTAGERSDGGGILIRNGDLSLTDSTVSENSTTGDDSGGGGISGGGGFRDTLSLVNSTITGNSTTGESSGGGGISSSFRDFLVTDSTISENSTTGGDSDGGGISGGDVLSVLSLINSTIDGNSTAGVRADGGGIFFADGDLSLIDSTVSENSTTGDQSDGGGISGGGFGTLSLANSTITGNSTAGERSDGGGISSSFSNFLVTDSTISENSTAGYRSAGGGITGGYSNTTISLINSTVTENSTTGDRSGGGGIFSSIDDLSLLDSTISGNSTTGDFSYGGGISGGGFGTLSLTTSTITGNSTAGERSDGGGIASSFIDFQVTDSTISENSTTGEYSDGGGILVTNGNVLIADSTISGNSTAGFSGDGGGIFAFVSTESISLTGSTISGNVTTGPRSTGGGIGLINTNLSLTDSTVNGNGTQGYFSRGGGIAGFGSGLISLTNATVSGNSTTGDESRGGGIFTNNARSDLTLTNSTVTGNSTTGEFVTGGLGLEGADGLGGGGGIYALSFGEVSLFNSIVAGNTSIDEAPDIGGGVAGVNITAQRSLIGDSTGSGITSTTGVGNILDQPALLGPLVDNGSLTLTHALLPGSPAIDAGSNILAVDNDGNTLTTDQRGAGFDRINFERVDIGAIESDIDAAPIAPVVLSVTIDEGGVLARPDLWNTLTVVFDADVNVAATDLSLFNDSVGGSLVDLTGIGFGYDSLTNTATWDFTTLAVPLDAAFYTYRLDAGSITGDGLSLDGNGDGTAGGDFVAEHYLAIPGDANLDGRVDVLGDALALVGNLNSTTEIAWADGNFDGDGIVDVLGDALLLVSNLGRDVRDLFGVPAPPSAVAADQSSSSVVVSPFISSVALDSSSDTDEQDEVGETPNITVTPASSASLALAGDHDLRDDVFGSEF